VGAKHGLGLSDEEARSLWQNLPTNLVTTPISEAHLTRIEQNLSDEHHAIEVRPVQTTKSACQQHPLLIRNSLCQSCHELACGACIAISPKSHCSTCAKSKSKWRAFRSFRIFALAILAILAFGITYGPIWNLRRWKKTVFVNIHPIAAQASEEVDRYIRFLDDDDFRPIEEFMIQEGRSWQLRLDSPIKVSLSDATTKRPPNLSSTDPNTWDVIKWSLKFRYWAYKVLKDKQDPPADIDVFVLYYPPQSRSALTHSVGL